MTNPTNPSTTKPSTVETIKDKATNLVHKVTGKTHHSADDRTHQSSIVPPAVPAESEHHKNLDGTTATKHGDVNPSAFLTSVRVPHDGAGAGMAAAAPNDISQPEAVHDPNHPHQHSTHQSIPAYASNTAPHATMAGSTGTTGTQHHLSGADDAVAAASAVGNDHLQSKQGVSGHNQQHKTDMPEHAITSKLVGAEDRGGDPNNLGNSNLNHPVM
ncbi:hypothetical protein BGZ83_001444 [Gryganskiella cystojenkinii]|nr:hypothetical protein BGZ83_001444 [Gryganskiella cystojenkinii]